MRRSDLLSGFAHAGPGRVWGPSAPIGRDELLDIGKRRLHARISGSGAPVVVKYIRWLGLPPSLPAEWTGAATAAEAAQILWDGFALDVNAVVRVVFVMDLFERPGKLPDGAVYEPR